MNSFGTLTPIWILYKFHLLTSLLISSLSTVTVTGLWNPSSLRHISCFSHIHTHIHTGANTLHCLYSLFLHLLSLPISHLFHSICRDLVIHVCCSWIYFEKAKKVNQQWNEKSAKLEKATVVASVSSYICAFDMSVWVLACESTLCVSSACVSDHIYIFNVCDWIMYEPTEMEERERDTHTDTSSISTNVQKQ